MLAAYGIDVLDPEVSPRRVHMLMERLPPGFHLPGEQWSQESDLLAALVDQVAMLTWVTLRVNGAKGAAKPRPIKRPSRRGRAPARPAAPAGHPGVDAGPGKAAGWMEAARMMAGLPGVVVRDG